MVLEKLSVLWNAPLTERRFKGKIGSRRVKNQRFTLLAPQTYMNLSGQSVALLVRELVLDPQQVLVVHDDADLPFEQIRFRRKGSAGGHNGIESIIQELGTDDFARLKIGISRPGTGQWIPHVLGEFSPPERETLPEILDRAVAGIRCWLLEGIDRAMNQYNGDPKSESEAVD
jgi:PTH1 family peptidyl-tRNA hydrolase